MRAEIDLMNISSPKLLQLFLTLLPLMLVAQNTIFNRGRRMGEYAQVDFHASLNIVLVILSCFVLIISLPHFRKVWAWMSGTSGRAIVYFYIFCILSATWSPMVEYSLYRSVESLSQILAIFLVFAAFKDTNFEQAERRLLFLTVVTILLGVGMHFRNYGLTPSLFNLHTNSYSTSAAMVFCYCVGEVLAGRKEGKLRLMIAGSTALVFLLAGTSTASYIAGLFGLGVATLLARKIFITVCCFILGITGFFLMDAQDVMDLLFFGKNEARVGTLSGRENLWVEYWRLSLKHPFVGNGYAVTPRIAEHMATNSHNSIFGVALGTGMVGLLFIVTVAIKLFVEILNSLKGRNPGSAGCASIFAAASVNAMSLSFIGENWMPPSFVFFCFFAFHLFWVFPRQKFSKSKLDRKGQGSLLEKHSMIPPYLTPLELRKS